MSANSSLLPSLPNTTTITEITPEAVENERIFFQTAAARGISGVFVWLSLIITCHQVRNRTNLGLTSVFLPHKQVSKMILGYERV